MTFLLKYEKNIYKNVFIFFSQASECHAMKHCIKKVWENPTEKLPADNDSVCEVCLDMVKQARDQLLSNETQVKFTTDMQILNCYFQCYIYITYHISSLFPITGRVTPSFGRILQLDSIENCCQRM